MCAVRLGVRGAVLVTEMTTDVTDYKARAADSIVSWSIGQVRQDGVDMVGQSSLLRKVVGAVLEA